jgi:peptidoglycan/xylan/chitin deacetylase (PgdA/CDA1 family)
MREIAQFLFFELTKNLGINSCARWLVRSRLLILCYHGIVAEEHAHDAFRYRNTVSLRQFREQLAILKRLFHPISAQDLLDHFEGKSHLPPKPVLVTFDDGFRNNLTNAAPVLEQYGIPAVFHVTTGYIGNRRRLWTQELLESILQWPRKVIQLPGGEPDEAVPADASGRIALANKIRELCKQMPDADRRTYLGMLSEERPTTESHLDKELYDFLSWDEVRLLHKRGFEIGSHTVEHPILTRLDPQSLEYELQRSKSTIEQELGTACHVLAYPNGGREDFSPEVLSKIKELGYKIAFTLTQQFNVLSANPHQLSRISIVGQVPSYVFHSRISGIHSLLRRFR